MAIPLRYEAVSGAGPLAGFTLTHSPDTLDRPGGTDLTKSGSAVHSSLYGYNAAGRPSTLSHAGRSVTYAYHPTRQRLAVTSLIGTSGQTNLIHEQVHDNAGRLLHAISHATPTGQSTLTPVHLSKYTLNDVNQRTATAELGDRSWSYGYNATGEVTRGSKTITSTGEALAGRSFLYEYDGIGNRLSTQTGGDAAGENLRTASYTANALNQYSATSHPGFLEIYGKAPVAQTVTVNTLPATRQGTDFRRELGFDNSSGQHWETIITNGGIPLTTHHYIPAASTVPSYDLDGNLTSDGQWIYTWDAENRLTSAERTPAALNAGAPYRLITYGYDSQFRQISRSVATTSGGQAITTLYLYDGWNCIAEYTGTSLTRTFLWGLDLSGSMQAAGGVGGLLSISDIATATTHYPCYDGNGNVRKLLHAATLVTTATYDYGPFGELTRATGTYALSNPYRFSTKPQDAETGLYYYGYRYYDPVTGRWTSKDPIEERGGWNLYGFLQNDGVNGVDVLGLFDPNDPDFTPPSWEDRRSGTNWGTPDDGGDQGAITGTIVFDVKDLTKNGATGTISLGVQLFRTGEIRMDYERLAAELKSKGLSDQESKAARDALKAKFIEKQTALGKAMTEQILEQRRKAGHVSGKNNPGKTNVKVNATARVFKYTGRALATVGFAVEIYNVASAPEGDRLGEAARAGGRVGGGFAGGAATGAGLGALGFNPVTIGVGAVIGGIAGSFAGEAAVEVVCPEK